MLELGFHRLLNEVSRHFLISAVEVQLMIGSNVAIEIESCRRSLTSVNLLFSSPSTSRLY